MAILTDPPEWEVPGTKPPRNIIEVVGWEVGSRPPAPWWNWFFYTVAKSLRELETATLARIINEAGVPGIMAGPESERPDSTPESAGRIFIATDTKRVFRDRGNGWDLLNTPEAIGAETPAGAQAKADAAAAAAEAAAKSYADSVVSEHANRTDNPHHVTASQVPYSSGVAGFSPADVAAALDALAGARIVEMGNNANGTYVCWENGLQVCWKRLVASDFSTTDQTTQTTDVQGLTYRFRTYTWTFPKPFAVVPIVFASGDLDSAAPEYHAAFTSSTTTARCEAGTLSPAWNYLTGNVLAIGHWK